MSDDTSPDRGTAMRDDRLNGFPWQSCEAVKELSCDLLNKQTEILLAPMALMKASQTYFHGISSYTFDFLTPFWVALNSFLTTEKRKITEHDLGETLQDYMELLHFNLQIYKKNLISSNRAANEYHAGKSVRFFTAWLNTVFNRSGEDLSRYAEREAKLTELLVYEYPKAIKAIEPEFGFHFDDGGYRKAAETERFFLYQVLPRNGKAKVRPKGKPIIILPPYVLGASILAFLPNEGKSYSHSFADQGIPTYIRVLKNINETPAVQVMTGEDDCLDTRRFCEIIKKRHGRPVTLNGFCQGGFVALLDLLTGELDGLVDALITCVAPIDGTRSKSLVEYLDHIPQRFRDLGYAVKNLPNGNVIVDGKVMSWVYKLKSIEREAPFFTFYRDLKMFDRSNPEEVQITKTAAALNYWLIYERNDLPRAICQMSFDSYTIPISTDGAMPVKLFGRSLNLKRLNEMKMPWLLCYAEEDDLVDKDSALGAAQDFCDIEVTVFPKGHGAIATSWSLPTSECALHKTFRGGNRGPVRFQMDLDKQ